MRRVAVFVATTSGPVRIERITRERAPQSVVCLKRTSQILPISAAYDSFVRPGSGVIERNFGPFEDGAFRLDVSAPIDSGASWQLGFVVAHAVAANAGAAALSTEAESDTILWLTGAVDYDLGVGSVGHIAEKLHASAEALAAWCAAGKSVILVLPEGRDGETIAADGVPEGVSIRCVASARDALAVIDLAVRTAGPPAIVPLPMPPLPAARPAITRTQAVGFALFVLAFLLIVDRFMPGTVMPFRPADAPPQEAPARPEAIATPPAAKRATVAAPAALSVPPGVGPQGAGPKGAETAPAQASLTIVERRAPAGHTCADVQFGKVNALETPIAAEGGREGTSLLEGLCGLGLVVDNGAQKRFAAVVLDVLSGTLLYGTERPRLLGGETAFAGRQEWPIDLPRRMQQPFALRATAISAPHPTAEAAQALKSRPGLAATAGDPGTDGVAVATLHHRVIP